MFEEVGKKIKEEEGGGARRKGREREPRARAGGKRREKEKSERSKSRSKRAKGANLPFAPFAKLILFGAFSRSRATLFALVSPSFNP